MAAGPESTDTREGKPVVAKPDGADAREGTSVVAKPDRTGPLEGFRILDLTAMLTGPLATMILADQGAEVVKVERPGTGDVMRFLGTMRGGMSTFFATCNRGKRSIVVDLARASGREIVLELASRADVFVQNFRPGVIERLGLAEPLLRDRHPELVYVSLSAFGETGPYAHRPAYDHVIQAMTGAPYLQGSEEDGRPEFMRTTWCDKVTALTVAQAITAALLARQRGRGGQHLRLSMLDASLAFLWPDGFVNHTLIGTEGVTALPPIAATYRAVEARDGFIAVAAVTDEQWVGLFRAAGRPDLARDPRMASAGERFAHLAEIGEELESATRGRSRDELLAKLVAEDVPCAPILRLEEVAGFEQVEASGTLVESVHPVLGRMREPRPPVRFDATPAAIARPAPRLGEHTDAVLAELGLDASRIAELRGEGAVA